MSATEEATIKYGTMVTPVGKELIAAAIAGKRIIDIAAVAIGDGAGVEYEVEPGQTGLKNQVYQGKPNTVYVDPKHPNYVVVELYVPETIGGWWIREVAIKTAESAVLAVGAVPAVYKPATGEGSSIGGLYRFIMKVADASVINLIIDPSTVMATIEYVDGQMTLFRNELNAHIRDTKPHNGTYEVMPERLMWRNKDGRCQVADPLHDKDATNKGTVAKTIKEKIDERKINTDAPLTGGGSLATDLTLGVSKASTSALGVVELATAAEVAAGTDAFRVITPSALMTALEAMGLLIYGDLRLMPFRPGSLAPGWHFCNGIKYLLSAPQGRALLRLPDELRLDLRIVSDGSYINIPDLFYNGKGVFFRTVNGTTRLPGSIEQDGARRITGTATSTASSTATSAGRVTVTASGTLDGLSTPHDTSNPTSRNPSASGPFSTTGSVDGLGFDGGGRGVAWQRATFNLNQSYTVSAPSISTAVNTALTISQANIADEYRPVNFGMTPAIYLGV